MKKLTLALLCAALLLGALAACGGKTEASTSLPSLTDVRDDAAETAGSAQDNDTQDGDAQPGGGNPASLPEEPAFIDEGEAAANVTDDEVVSDFSFKMDYPSDWSYFSKDELGLDSYYIFAAGNRATGASIVVSQPLDAENTTLDTFADALYTTFEDTTVPLYTGMGITSELKPLATDTLGGRSAKRIDLYCQSSEAEFVQSTYVVETPTGEIITVLVSTYSDEDAAVAETALASISWG